MSRSGLNTNVCPSASECDDDNEQFDADAKAKAKADADSDSDGHFAAIEENLALEARERKPNRNLVKSENMNFSPYEPRTPFSTHARKGIPVDPDATSPVFKPRLRHVPNQVIHSNFFERNKFALAGLVVGLIFGSLTGGSIVAFLGADKAYWVASLFIGSLAGGGLGKRADNVEKKHSASEPMPKRRGVHSSTGGYAKRGLNLSQNQHGETVKIPGRANDRIDKRLARKNSRVSWSLPTDREVVSLKKSPSLGRAG